MSKAMTNKVSEYHDLLAQAMAPLRGRDLTQADVRKAYATAYPNREDDLQWLCLLAPI
jgi:hypothetical protein